MARIVITDLTRFKSESENVCTAGLDLTTQKCIRPMPYLKKEYCRRNSVKPGTILEGEFRYQRNPKPHIENHSYSNLKVAGSASEEVFKSLLSRTSKTLVEDGLGCEVEEGQKYVPENAGVERSLFTLKLDPDDIYINKSNYGDVDKYTISFSDASRNYKYISITDLGFFESLSGTGDIATLSSSIKNSSEFFLRVGLSQLFEHPEDGRRGYWMQVNGIYSFPTPICLDRGFSREKSASTGFKRPTPSRSGDSFMRDAYKKASGRKDVITKPKSGDSFMRDAYKKASGRKDVVTSRKNDLRDVLESLIGTKPKYGKVLRLMAGNSHPVDFNDILSATGLSLYELQGILGAITLKLRQKTGSSSDRLWKKNSDGGYVIDERTRQLIMSLLKREKTVPASGERYFHEVKRESQSDEDLFEALKELRLEISREEGVPAYVVFDNRALREMSEKRPANEADFLQIYGVGDLRLEKYGEAFLRKIREFS